MRQFDRVKHQPGVMGGRPCIRGMRITVELVAGLVGAGRSVESILADYPYLEREDIAQALAYAEWRTNAPEVSLA